MTDKEIIIDGVNAAECEFLSKEHSFTNPKGQCKIKLKDCKFINNCQYKQLKRLEQENAELKAENVRLKEELETYGATGVCEVCSDKANKLADKYLGCLQEIKAIAKDNIIGCFSDKCDLAAKILAAITKAESEEV